MLTECKKKIKAWRLEQHLCKKYFTDTSEPGPLQTSNTESFATKSNSRKSLTIVVKLSIFNVCAGPCYNSVY